MKIQNRNRLHLSRADRTFLIFIYVLIAVVFIAELYPLIFVLSASISSPSSVASGRMLLFPKELTFKGYEYVLQYREIWTGYANTIFYTFFATVFNLFLTLPAAYALSRRDMGGRGILMCIFMVPMYFSGGMIAGYLNIQSFGFINTRWALLIPGGLSVYNMIVARTFFANTIPWSLQEAARIDGANDFRTFISICMPLSKPIIAVLCLYYGVGHWNAYFGAMMYQSGARELWPLSLVLREVLIRGQFLETAMMDSGSYTPEEMMYLIRQADTANLIKYAVIIVSVVPMFAIYPFLQKYFAKGVMLGSVKG